MSKKPGYCIFLFLIFNGIYLFSQEPIPTTKGFHGYLNINIGYLRFRNNQVAQFMSYHLNEEKISSIDGVPGVQNNAMLTFPLEIGYTFIPYKTHIFIGNLLEDLIRFDVTQQLGIKQRLGSAGVLEAGILYTSLPTKVWEDHFLTDTARTPTKRTAFGFLLVWDQPFSSAFRIKYTYRDVVVDNELSGLSLDLTPEDLKLLDRNGDMHALEIQYKLFFAGKHRLVPAFEIIRDKRKGGSRSRTTYDFIVNYVYNDPKITAIANGRIGYALYDETNPVYRIRQKDIRYAVTGAFYIVNPMEWKIFGESPFRFTFAVGYNYVDANIEFYQQRGILIQLGLITRW